MSETGIYASTDGKYTSAKNQVAWDHIGDTSVSTIWWKRDGHGGDWFETLLFRKGKAVDSRPTTHATETDALKFHRETVSDLRSARLDDMRA